MVEYSIIINRPAEKELDSLETVFIKRVVPKIDALAQDPRPHGCRKIVGEKNLWRIRIGDFRVIYAINDEERIIEVTGVRHRSNAYD